jgi:hypothetical protein
MEKAMNKILMVIIVCLNSVFAGNGSGFVKFNGSESWVIEIGDSLSIQTDTITSLPTGSYTFKARPQISYNWPAVLIEETIEIHQGDTLNYYLSAEKSNAPSFSAQTLPKTTTYSETGFQPSIRKHTSLKTGLIISVIAANWLSFYLKREADDYFRDYKSASNLSKINNFYDKSKQFDRYSNIMLGISTVALSSYIYLTLTD